MADVGGEITPTGVLESGFTAAQLIDNNGGLGGVVSYINRVYDAVAVGFVRWTTSTPDTAGTSYPGPDAFGNTTDYCVEAVL